MELTLLGTGNPIPDPRRAGPSQLVRVGDDRILVDCGTGAVRRLVDQDSCMIAFDYYLATHRAAPDQVVSAVLKALWENAEKHPEAIRFYQERGVWSAEMERVQKRLLALNP